MVLLSSPSGATSTAAEVAAGIDLGAAYGQSKTANVLFAVEATRRWAADGITANALMPGGIFTNLQRHWDPAFLASVKESAGDAAKSPEQGAATSVLLATSATAGGHRRPVLRGLSRGRRRRRDRRRPARRPRLRARR